jgi:Mg2+-importing ATPase
MVIIDIKQYFQYALFGAAMSPQDKSKDSTYTHAGRLYRAAQKKPEDLFKMFKSSYQGLTKEDVEERLTLFGPNTSSNQKQKSLLHLFMKAFRNEINYLIFGLAIVSYFAGNVRASILMMIVVLMSILMTFIQETRFHRVVHRLLNMTTVNVNVIRNDHDLKKIKSEDSPNYVMNTVIPITELVPGDIIKVSTGDIVPADIRLLTSKNLLVNQSVLTGETIPIEKDSEFDDALLKNLPDLKNICFLGSCVVTGSGLGIVIHTGQDAYVSSISKECP